MADTALSATLLTNLLYALAIDSGEFHLLITVPNLSLNGFHADCSELIIDFWDSMYSSEISLAI
jgi:hypothetical protein